MRLRAFFAVILACFVTFAACGGRAGDAPPASPGNEAPPSAAPAAPDAKPAPRTARPGVIVLGDSLTAGLGLDIKDSFPSRLQDRIDRGSYGFEVINAGVSGDTSAGGLRRLDWAMSDGDPKVLIVALGGNDGLRGLAPEQLEENLGVIIQRAQSRGLTVILAGMEAPPNFGDDYTTRFRAVYPALAKKYDVRLIPFLLDGVAGDPSLNQGDGIHPNVRGAERVAELVWKTLEPALTEARSSSSR